MTTSAIQIYETPAAARAGIDSIFPMLMEVMPRGIDGERFRRIAVKAIVGNPKIMECTQTSLLAALMEAAQLGLEPSGMLGSAYLVPYNVKVKLPHPRNANATVEQKILEAKLIPGYRGLIDLARRSGEILKIEARTVRLRDHFILDFGADQPVIHRPFIANPMDPPEEQDPGPYLGAYMRAVLKGDPTPQVEWMSYQEIAQVRTRSRASGDGPWVTDEPEMMRKTVVRRGSKYLPLTTELTRALELDEEAERGAIQDRPAQLSRAQQMLADRAVARGTAPEPPEGKEAASSGPDAGSVDPASPEHEHKPKPMTPAGHEAGDPIVCEGCGEVMEEPQSKPEMPDAPASAREICGEEGDDTGACTRAPDHPGGHKNADHLWPRAKGAKGSK